MRRLSDEQDVNINKWEVCSDWYELGPNARVDVCTMLPSPFRLGGRKLALLENLGYVMQYGSILFECLKVCVRPLSAFVIEHFVGWVFSSPVTDLLTLCLRSRRHAAAAGERGDVRGQDRRLAGMRTCCAR